MALALNSSLFFIKKAAKYSIGFGGLKKNKYYQGLFINSKLWYNGLYNSLFLRGWPRQTKIWILSVI